MDDKFDYFIRRTERDFTDLKKELGSVKDDVKRLLEFKWQIIGGSIVVSAVISVVISVVLSAVKH